MEAQRGQATSSILRATKAIDDPGTAYRNEARACICSTGPVSVSFVVRGTISADINMERYLEVLNNPNTKPTHKYQMDLGINS